MHWPRNGFWYGIRHDVKQFFAFATNISCCISVFICFSCFSFFGFSLGLFEHRADGDRLFCFAFATNSSCCMCSSSVMSLFEPACGAPFAPFFSSLILSCSFFRTATSSASV